MKIVINYLGLIIICLFLTSLVKAQDSNQEQVDPPNMVVSARVEDNTVLLNWYPTNPEDWGRLLKSGYKVTRTEVDEFGNIIGAPSVLVNDLLPKGEAWFAANGGLQKGLMEPIGTLLYDPRFKFPEGNGVLNENEMKYNFLVYESINNNLVASTLGLGLQDDKVNLEKIYRYEVEGIGTKNTGSVDVSVFNFNYQTNNDSYYTKQFEFPNGLSLSDMLNRTQSKKFDGIRAISRAYQDSVVVRWGPTSSTVWKDAMENGYEVYRINDDLEWKLIKKVYPWKKDEITPDIFKDSMAIVAASILHDDNASVRYETEGGIYQKASIYENIFGLSLFAAERSALAADILGFRFVDKDVESNKYYEYMIGTSSLSSRVDWGFTELMNTYEEEPAPTEFRAISREKKVKLVWSKLNENRFSAYNIERSTDSINYELLNDLPIVIGDSRIVTLKEFIYLDEVGVNEKPFYYRLSGMNSFGEWSQFAYAKGMGRDFTPPIPVLITEATFNDTTKIFELRWEDPANEDTDLSNYQVLLSHEDEGFYSAVSPMLTKNEKSFTLEAKGMDFDNLQFFFKIQSQDVRGNISSTMSKYIIVPDQARPDPPTNLVAEIDTNGIVQIAWTPSKAADLRGYKIFWGNDPTEEMVAINGKATTDNYYSWQINDKVLNEKLYLFVTSEDKSYRKSKPSEVIAVDRPDKVPPIQPYMDRVIPGLGYLTVAWQPSPSEDVQTQYLYRKKEDAPDYDWELITDLNFDVYAYSDTFVDIDEFYEYKIKAEDDAGNTSFSSNTIDGKLAFPRNFVKVEEVDLTYNENDVELISNLSWNYTPLNKELAEKNYEFEIYRSTGAKNIEFYSVANSSTNVFSDSDIQPNVLYNYAIRIRFDNGWTGDLSEVKSILVQ